MLAGDAPVVISSQLLNRQDGEDEYHLRPTPEPGVHADPRKAGAFEGRVLLPRSPWPSDDRMMLGYQCANSRMTVVVAADHAAAHGRPLRGHPGRRAGPHQDGLPHRRPAGQHAADREGGGLPHLARAARARAVRPLRRTLDRTARYDLAHWLTSSATGTTRSGRPATSRSPPTTRTTRPSSRPSGSTCSRWPRPAGGPTGTASRPRASPARATRGTTSGTARSTSRRSSATPAPSWPAT